jgi:hypothetical protein
MSDKKVLDLQIQGSESTLVTQLKPPMFQRQLFPIAVMTVYPNDQNSQDMKTIGLAENGKDYAIKTVMDGNGKVPASEAFCYQLARHVLLATPEFDVIELHDGSYAFGSVWEGAASTIKHHADVMRVLSGEIPVVGIQSFFSKVYALDLFVNNIDRHFGNYIFRPSYSGQIALAFDFSRAWFAFNPYGFEAAIEDNATSNSIQWIKRYEKYNKAEAERCLDIIKALTAELVEAMLSSFPQEWLSVEDKQSFLEWWGSEARIQRVDFLKGIL